MAANVARMISNISTASFSSTLRGVGGIVPRSAPALTASPSLGTAPGASGALPSANSPRGSLLDVSA